MDSKVFYWIFSLSGKSNLLDAFGIFLASYLPYILVLGLIILFLREKDSRVRLALFGEALLAVVLSRGIITGIIRFFYDRPRPFEALDITSLFELSSPSFPSGHMTLLCALGISLFFVSRKWGGWFLGLSVLVGLARVFAGVHWPLDVVGGILIGIAGGFLIHVLVKPSYIALRLGKGSGVINEDGTHAS